MTGPRRVRPGGAVRGVEVTVRLDNGRVVAITQGLDEVFNAGERVRVLTSADGQARVTR